MWLSMLIRALRKWRQHRHDTQAFTHLDDRCLRDIGMAAGRPRGHTWTGYG